MKRFSINLLKFSAISFIAVFLFLTFRIDDASAATRTWTGTTSGSWSVASNWGGTAPVTGDDLVFPAGASNLSNTNDFTENTIFNSITISGSGYTLSGNPIILGAGLAGLTDSASSGGNTIALDIRLDVTRDIVVTNAAETLTISGRISGVGGINKEGLGKLVLSGANTFGGTLKINVGVVNAQNNTALGTIAAGTEIVGGAALELQGGIDISYEALALRGYGVSTSGALRNISENNTFRGLITLSSAGGAEIASDSGTLTLTGGTTGNFPLVLDGAGNITFSTAPIAGSGAVTKNGAGTVTLNFPNTNTGAWVINQGTLLYGVDNALMTNAIKVTGGTFDIATFSDMVGTVTLGTLDLASGTITGSTGVLSSATWTLYNGTISAIIAGVGGTMTKSTTGTVTLTRPNLYTGGTTVSLGILKIQNSTALGVIDGITTVTAGATLEIDGSGLSIPEYITFSGTGHLYTGAIRNRTGDNTLTGLLTLGTAGLIEADTGTTLTIDGKGLSAANIGLVIGGAGNVTFTENAPIYGSGATLTKNDTGTLTLQAFNNFTGATNLTRGSIVLSGAGAMPNSAITVGNNATLTLDNSSTSVINRISDTAAFTMNGGTLNFIGNATSTALETAGALTLSSGHNIVTVTPGAGGPTTMIFASLSRTAGATALFRGTDFGSNPAPNISTLMFNTAPTLTGGGGSANSSTISIIKGVFGDGVSGTGSDMVTYNIGNSNGIRLLNGAGFSGEYVDTLTTNANVKLSANTPASTASINSLILNGFDITNPGSAATLTLTSASLSGNILINSANNIAGANTTLGITTNELPILATASGSISAVIGTAVAGSLTLSGPGTVTLSAANAYTGTTSINGTTLFAGASNVLSTGGLTIVGGTYDIGNFNESLGAVILQNGTITGGSGVLTSTASYSFREGTVSAIIAGSVAVTRIATSAAADSVVTMTRDNTYTGATTITSGILRLGGAGGGTNTPLGTTGGATTVANIAALDLNGYTLGTAEAISIAGLGYGLGSTVANGNSNMGAIMNTSSTPASYSGAITLTAAARINADAGALTISSAISGAFGLTIGGFSDSTFSGVIGTGTGTITKDGIGVLTLSNSNTYTGATTISTGTVKLGAAGGATNTPLGTTGAGTTVSTGARIDLNGFTLGTAEGLTLNGVGYGLGDFASGALINSSGSSVSYSGAVTLGSTGVLIKADSGNITLSGAFSGATFALTIGGTGSGTISGVIGTTTGTVTKIGTGTWTLSNAASTYTGATSVNLGTLKLGVSGGATNTPLGTTGGGTSVMSGAVLDFNGFTVGTAEALTINGRGINDGGAVIGANVTFAGTIAQATDSRITNASGTFTISGAVTGAFNIIVSGAGNTTFSAATGTAGLSLTKQGAGTLTITGTNTHTGATRVEAGTLAYAGTTTMAATPLTVLGGTFNNGANADTIGTVTLIGGTITNSAALTAATSYTLESGTISGIIAGAIPVTKNTNNTVTLTGANTISSTVTVNAGTLTFSGNGTATSVTGFTVNLGGTLSLDNSSTAVASRIGDAIVITMNGGNFNFSGNTAGTASETIGQFAFASGHNTVTVTPGAGGSTTLTVANNPGFNRTAGATVLFRGTSFGSTPAANVSTLMFTTAPTLTGGGGGSSTTTISVIKAAFGDSSLSGTGSDMVTYNVGNTNGLRLLNGAGFSGEYAGDLQTANANVKLTADRAAVATNTNSLITNGFAITNPGSAVTIPVASASLAGNILINSANNIAGSNTTLGITTFELPILATASSTISAVIGTATTGALTLSGSGNATLSAANAYTGTTYVNNATLTYGTSNVISTGGLTVVGGTVNLNGNSDTVGTISINAGTITTGAGTLTGNGTFSTVANNNAASIISGNLGLGANATFTINDGLMDNDALISAVVSGGFTFAKAGSGVLELSGSNTYTGTTTISAGTLRLGAAGDSTNTPLGTTGGGTTVSGASSALDLNGYTLGTSEVLTLSGALATGALQNTSSTAVNYTGLITLGAASTIISNYGDINITNTGTITGATFGLTIGGAGNGTLSSILGTTSGTLTKNGLGVWTVSGSSTYTGLTTISAGTLKLGAAGGATNTPLGTTGGATSITSGAILDLNGYTLGTAEAVTINGTGIASIGAFINSSNNTISYTGAITMGAASRIANHGTGVTTLTGNISGNFALTVVAVGNFTQSTNSVWSGTGTLVKEGSGILTLSGQNTMSGAMTVSTGVLQLGASGGATNTPLGTNAGGVTVALGAVLDLSTFSLGGASTYETLNISGTGIKEGGAITSTASGANNFGAMTVTANALVKNSGSGLITFGGTVTIANTINFGIGGTGPTTISGIFGATATTATINKWDSGILTISAASITTGLVRINGGTLKYGVADALSTPAVTVAGGTLDLNGFNETNIGAVTLIDGSIINGGGAATLTSTATYTLEKGTVSAVLGGTVVAVIAKNTAGRVILSGDNTFSGTSATITINAGYLNLRHNNALGAAASANTTTIAGGASLELENGITIPAVKAITANGTGMANAGAIRSVNGTNTIGANITLGTTNVRINADSGGLTIPSVSGNTFSSIFGGAGSVTVSGAIGTTSGTVTKDGAGTLTLNGTNTYTGTTTILAGTIVASSSASLGDGSATNTFIFRGGTLQASGTITSPSTRAFTLASNATFDTNGNSISIAGTVGSSGGLVKNGSGALTITGAITLGGDFINNAGTVVTTSTPWTFSGNTNQSIDSITTTGLISMTKSGGTATLQGAVSGGGLTINGSGGTLDLNGFTHSFSGDVTLTAGTLVAGASTINLSSTSVTAWNGDGSLFVPGSSTVNFSGTNQTLAASNLVFNNLTFSGGGTKTLGSTLVVNGDLTNSSGTPTYATWNPSDKSTHITLSNGNLTATNDGASNNQVRATVGLSSGKWYWELYFTRTGDTAYPYFVPFGMSKTTESVEVYSGATADGLCISTDGDKWTNGTNSAYTTAWSNSDVIGVALDMDAGSVTIYRNNTSLGTLFSGLTGTYYPATGSSFGTGYTTANFGATAFTYTPPNGYNAGVYTGGSSVTIATGNNPITLKGNFVNSGNLLDAGNSNITVDGVNTQTIAGFTTTGAVSVTKTGGAVTFGDNITASSISFPGATATVNLGSNIFTLSGTGTVWDMASSTSVTVNPGSSTIKLTNSSSSGKTFAGGGKTYNNFWFAPSTGTGSLTISGNNTFNDFKDNGTVAHSLLFTTGSTQHISTWNVSGNPGQLITINSTTTGTHNLVKNASGGVTGDYLNIQHSVASPYGGWFAGANSVDNQNVASAGSGWFFFRETIYRGGGGGGETDNGTGSGTCADGVQNGNETGIDTGGRCANTGGGGGGGSGGDGGGDNGTGSGTCADGIQNGNETGIDTGGRCGNTGGGGGGGGDSGFLFPRGRLFASAFNPLLFNYFFEHII